MNGEDLVLSIVFLMMMLAVLAGVCCIGYGLYYGGLHGIMAGMVAAYAAYLVGYSNGENDDRKTK